MASPAKKYGRMRAKILSRQRKRNTRTKHQKNPKK